MELKRLSLLNFKNVAEARMEFASRLNCFVGGNGAGKTNVLDAVHYLSMCKSAFGMSDAQSIRHGADFFLVDGEYRSDSERRESVVCSCRRGAAKVVKRAGKQYEKLSDHIGLVPIVMVSPSDTSLISESGEERRRYLNAFISQLDREYLAALVRYNHLLAERNKLLKLHGTGMDDVLEVIDLQMAEAGGRIYARRKEMLGRIAPMVAEYYALLAGDRERIELSYKSELDEAPMDELLRRSREKDRVMQFTTSGVHRDDIRMRIGGYALRKYGSQGQQKSFLVALKLAQYKIVAEAQGERPLLLLDDIFDKLDMRRVERLIALVCEPLFGQIFITDCNKVRLEGILDRCGEAYTLFDVADGEIGVLSGSGRVVGAEEGPGEGPDGDKAAVRDGEEKAAGPVVPNDAGAADGQCDAAEGEGLSGAAGDEAPQHLRADAGERAGA
ncbi:MAG: DNA replication and repair protein RecF [Rikenellaceae bacterium]|nr:DNA replication and repair protein RecF [Rikenellaceae bacterium]